MRRSAMMIPIIKSGIERISPTSAPNRGSANLKIEYARPHHIMMIVSCLRESHATIVSSFSICNGILYCIRLVYPKLSETASILL